MGPVTLLVLDGWGYSEEKRGNAIRAAKTPNYNNMLAKYPNTLLQASGVFVGLPPGLMGNSEVGHLTIGAGRVVVQKLTMISNTIHDGTFFQNPVFSEAIKNVQNNSSALHLIGLVSDGCVHSSPDHIDALLELAKRNNIKELIVHPILDGRDTPPRSALGFIKDLQTKLDKVGKIGVISGRYYAMDRDNRWERTELYWQALIESKGRHEISATKAIEDCYQKDETDEFIKPIIISDRGIKDGDSVICFNFRPDRVRQISRCLTQSDFQEFQRLYNPKIFYACMTEYDSSLNLPIAFSPAQLPTSNIDHTLPEILSCHHIGQFHTAETEKYAHVTYFLNGGREKPEDGEERMLVPSLKVATYDKAPAMQTPKVCELACKAIASGDYPFIVLNFANPDMVGHTGILEAGVEAIESVDQAFAALLETTQQHKGTLIITADHGNIEQMINLQTGEPHTAHTTNPVPLMVADFQAKDLVGLQNGTKVETGTLADVAPTILQIMGIDIPSDMNGRSLLHRH